MGRVAAADRRRNPQGPAGLDPLDVDRLPALEDGEVAGLPRVPHEPLQEREGLVPQVHPLHHQPAELEDVEPQAVATAAGVAFHQAGGVEVDHEAVDGGLVQPDPVGDLRHAELRLVRGEHVQDRHRPLDRLDPVAGADRPGRLDGGEGEGGLDGLLGGGRRGPPVSHREAAFRD